MTSEIVTNPATQYTRINHVAAFAIRQRIFLQVTVVLASRKDGAIIYARYSHTRIEAV